jgi:hypothetical protein
MLYKSSDSHLTYISLAFMRGLGKYYQLFNSLYVVCLFDVLTDLVPFGLETIN